MNEENYFVIPMIHFDWKGFSAAFVNFFGTALKEFLRSASQVNFGAGWAQLKSDASANAFGGTSHKTYFAFQIWRHFCCIRF